MAHGIYADNYDMMYFGISDGEVTFAMKQEVTIGLALSTRQMGALNL